MIPALMVYLGGCNFRCRFCTQAPRCFDPSDGPELTAPEALAQIGTAARHVRWINLVGGEPSLHPHALVELRRGVRTDAKWLLNTNGYFTPACLELIDPLIDLYLIDFKFGTDGCARALAGVSPYVSVLHRNLRAVAAKGPGRLLVRHLLMPGHENCCMRPVAEWMRTHMPEIRFHLMTGYVPNYRATRDPVLGRTVPGEDCERAHRYCRELGLRRVD